MGMYGDNTKAAGRAVLAQLLSRTTKPVEDSGFFSETWTKFVSVLEDLGMKCTMTANWTLSSR